MLLVLVSDDRTNSHVCDHLALPPPGVRSMSLLFGHRQVVEQYPLMKLTWTAVAERLHTTEGSRIVCELPSLPPSLPRRSTRIVIRASDSSVDGQIVDRAWELIVKRHPELDTSPADEARAAADIDLKRSCRPSVRLLDPHPPLLAHTGDATPVAAAANEGEAIAADGFVDDRGSSKLLVEGKDSNGDVKDDVGGGENDPGNVSAMQWDSRGQVGV